MARYGLVVSVASYKKPLSNLSKTEGDAKAVNNLLKQYGDFDDIQVLTGDVTREKLEDALGILLTERADRNNDRGVVDASTMFGYVAEQLRGTGQEAVSFGYGRALRIVDYRAVVARSEIDEACPYVGLNAFDQNTAKYFCGRDSQIDLLLRKIEASRFVPVIGASGSGKSSLVRAGLMPALTKQGWCVLPPIKPWFNPLMLLKQALVEQFYKLPTEIKKAYTKLEREGLNAILPEGSQRVLLVVD